MTGTKIILMSIISAIGSAFATQDIPGAEWGAEFLQKFGWLGLFVLSSVLCIYLYRKTEKERTKFDKMLQAERARFDEEIEEARDELIEEYKIRITQLAAQAAGK